MIEIIEQVRPGERYQAPTWRVRCSLCSETYLRTGSAANIRRAEGCTACRPGARARPRRYSKAEIQGSERARNQCASTNQAPGINVSETQLSRSIQLALKQLGIWYVRVQAGAHRVKGGMLCCAEPGTPDLCLPALGWLEVKTDAGALNPFQVAWHQRATREGVNVAVVRSVEQAIRIVREWQTGQQPPLCAGESYLTTEGDHT